MCQLPIAPIVPIKPSLKSREAGVIAPVWYALTLMGVKAQLEQMKRGAVDAEVED
jgi:hypothetical protein